MATVLKSAIQGCLSDTAAGSLCSKTHSVHRSTITQGSSLFQSRLPAPSVPCQEIEEWLYDRGPGNLVATVRFRAGVVQSITYDARASP